MNSANIGAFLNFKLRHAFFCFPICPNVKVLISTSPACRIWQQLSMSPRVAFQLHEMSPATSLEMFGELSHMFHTVGPFLEVNAIHEAFGYPLFWNWSEAQNSQCFVDLHWWMLILHGVSCCSCDGGKATRTPQNGFGHHHTCITIYGVGGSSFFCLEAEVPAFYHFATHIKGWRVVNRDGRAVLWQWRFTFP